MKIDEYISHLRNENVLITVEGDKLAIDAPDEALTSELIAELREKKSAIIDFFNAIVNAKKFETYSIPVSEVATNYPLSSAQMRMYFLNQLDTESTGYNIPGFYRLKGEVDFNKLQSAFMELVERHESLRTVFEMVDDQPVQRVVSSAFFQVSHFHGDASQIDQYIKEFVKPFNLASEPPVRVGLMEVINEDPLLIIDVHHIVNDGVSRELLLKEFWCLYHGYELEELKIQFKDYAVWQQGETYKELVETHKKYWLETYAEPVTSLELPTDQQRPNRINTDGAVHKIVLNKSLSDQIRSLAQAEGVTMYALFLTFYNILLSKISNQSDIVVGTATAGRHHSDLEGLVGMFVNTLALRNNVNAEATFSKVLADVQENTLSAFDHQLYQYDELVEALKIPRVANRNPLFDVFFSFGEEQKASDTTNTGLLIYGHEVPYEIAKFDLTLNVSNGETIELSFNYRKDLFEHKTVQRFGEYLERIIAGVATGDNPIISSINVLSDAEQSRLLKEFNDTFQPFDLSKTVIDKFREQAVAYPDNNALVFGDETLTYRKLDLRSDKWAKGLMDQGVQQGDVVALVMSRSIEMITAILAVMKAGAAYLPINPDQPESRSQHMLNESGSAHVISNIGKELPFTTEETAILTPQELDHRGSESLNLPGTAATSLAYIIYTSGSTGLPKGVMIHQEAVTNLIEDQKLTFAIDEHDRVLQFSPYYFDASVEQIWIALTSGASLVLVEENLLMDSDSFSAYLKQHKVTHLHATPSFLEKVSIESLTDLRRIVAGGEECKASLASRMSNQQSFYNEYGPTETTVTSTIQKIDHALPEDIISIGKPLGNTQLYVLDDQMNLLPEGSIGELYIGGKGLSSGYLKREQLTTERFVHNPFGEGLLYRTGDLVRWLSDGTLLYFGRNDQQVKIRGYRIELGEIATRLEALQQVDQAIVVVSGANGNEKLVAYLIGKETEKAEISAQLSRSLPDYMIPSVFVWLENIPLTANGKIDKRALPDPDLTALEEYVAPQNEDQHKLVKIWSEVLQIEAEKISVISDFFELGGHSLSAMTLANKINKTFSVSVPLRELFVYRTIEALASYLPELEETSHQNIPQAPAENHYPLSSAQKRMYFLYEFDKEGTSYNMPMFLRLGGTLDRQLLADVFRQLVLRHESLRTIFQLVNDTPVQRILTGEDFKIISIQTKPSDIDEHIKSFVRPFDLSKEPPVRVALLEVKGEDPLLMMDMHHIISDGVSRDILMKEFWCLYHDIALDEHKVQYKDFAVWQQSEHYQELVAKHKRFWLETFAEPAEALELPTDHYRSVQSGNEGHSLTFELDKSTSEKLHIMSRTEGVTMYNIFLTIFNIFLSKVSNQADIVVGTPTAGRHHSDLEGVVGMFVNTLALRNQVPKTLPLKELFTVVQHQTLQAFDHQLYQYEELVEDLGLQRELTRNPLFDVFYAYIQPNTPVDVNESDLKITGHDTISESAKFDLTCTVSDGDAIAMTLNYRKALFEEQTILRFGNYLNKLVNIVLQSPEITVGEIDILSSGERAKLLEVYNDTAEAYDLSKTVLQKFNEQVIQSPHADALIFGEEVLTYEELNVRANRWASFLIHRGVVSGEMVGLVMSRSTEMITAILAVMKTGAAYLPINPNQPLSRTALMLEENDTKIVLTNLAADQNDDLHEYNVIPTEELDAFEIIEEELPGVTPESRAYVIYTSGSTGKPKGVMIEHRSVSNLINFQTAYYGIQDDEKILQFSPYYFDGSVEQIWLALSNGASLVLLDNETLIDNNKLSSYLKDTGVTYFHATPSFLEKIDFGDLPELRRVITGGEACKPALAESITRTHALYNEYGPTESTVICTVHKVTKDDIEAGKVPIGQPMANAQVYVLDDDMNLLPEGAMGELYVGGEGLSTGYLKQQELTKERFVNNPFGDGRLYKTGDLVRWLPGGTLLYLGRNDDQVKVRGYRIELGEICAQLEKIDSVEEAIVLALGNGDDKKLVAYFTGVEIDKNVLRAKLSTSLPDYMIPSAFVRIEAFPVTANGKIDKRALPDPDLTNQEVYVAPQNDEQQLLVSIWSEVLQIERDKISVISDFFSLGGHSLTAITLANKINQAFAVSLPLRDLFVHRTIESLDSHITTLEKTVHVEIPVAPAQGHYPLTSAQKRMYFLYELDKSGTSYNMPMFLRLGGDVAEELLVSVFTQLASRHEIMRMVFELVEDEPVQRPLDVDQFEVTRLTGAPADIQQYIEEFVRPFNLSREPGVRVALMEVAGEDSLLMMDMHHIINDGVSREILMREFWCLYHGIDLEELRIQYKDYAVWQHTEAYQEMVEAHKTYWLDVFATEVTALELPVDFQRPSSRSKIGGVRSISFDQATSDQLRALAQQEGVTMYTLFLTVYNVLLSKISNQTDIVVGTPTAGRHHVDLENLVGMFVNTLALRNEVSCDANFKEMLDLIHENTISAFDHQLYQYEELIEALGIRRDVSRNPLFDVFFSYGKESSNAVDNESSLTITAHEVPYEVAKFDLTLSVMDSAEIGVSFSYSTDLFREETIDRFTGYLEQLVELVLENPQCKISELDILSSKERQKLLESYNNTTINHDLTKTVLDGFKTQAGKNPEATAIILNDKKVTYGALDERSDLWAGCLLDAGVRPGAIVALKMSRSVEMITAILAVMKSGAAYLPINPNQPDSRTNYMLEECGARLMITDLEESPQEDDLIKITPEKLDEFTADSSMDLPGAIPLDLAYIIYTSGSTGQPKGVMIHHEAVMNLTEDQKIIFSIKEDERILQFSPYYFDASVEQIWIALTSGATLVLIDEGQLKDVNSFADYLASHEVTHLHATPSFLEKIAIEGLSSLRRVVAGGEECKPSLAARMSHGQTFYNEYGPTETTVTSTMQKIEQALPNDLVSIGRPLGNTQVYVLDNQMKLLPEGTIGELYIGGRGLSSGYLNREELTEERFVNNPFGAGRLYKTGDLVRWLPNGTLLYLGRNDQQVKVRGYRIELGEIAAKLEQFENIDQAVVVTHGKAEDKKLIAYLVGEEIEKTVIKATLAEHLPEYMIPAAFVWLEAIPLTANGKVDLRALPNPDLTENEVYVAPGNSTEEQLAVIWSNILNIESHKISTISDFFEIGGNSLLAIKLQRQINRNFNVDFDLHQIFLNPDIQSIGFKIDTEGSQKTHSSLVPLNSHQSDKNLFMIHDGSGELNGYYGLSALFDHYNCFGLRFEGLDNLTETPRFEQIAADYIKEIRSVQMNGPYHLLGWSLGGVLATEVTRQLEAMGEQVESLTIIDAFFKAERPLNADAITIASEASLLQSEFGYLIEEDANINSLVDLWSQFAASEAFAQLSREDALHGVPENILQLIPDYSDMTLSELFLAVNKIRLLITSGDHYLVDDRISANTLFILPEESKPIQNIEILETIFSTINVKAVSGNHFSVMMKPTVNELFSTINEHLNAVESKSIPMN